MSRDELSWELHKEIKHESGICLRINKLNLRKPIFSFEIGVLKDGGYLNRFFPGGLSWDVKFAEIIYKLINQAVEYINEKGIESLKDEQDKLAKELEKRVNVKSRES